MYKLAIYTNDYRSTQIPGHTQFLDRPCKSYNKNEVQLAY